MHHDKTIDQTERRPANPQDFKTDRAALFQLWRKLDADQSNHQDGGQSEEALALFDPRQSAQIRPATIETDQTEHWRVEIEADNFEFWD